MARFNFLTGLFEVEENLTPERNMAQLQAIQISAEIQPKPSTATAITGTRTSGTVFTRGTGTWTVEALKGFFVWSFKTGAPAVGEFLKIADNDAATLTIDSTYGSGALQTTGTSVIILESTDEADAMKLLEEMSTWLKTA